MNSFVRARAVAALLLVATLSLPAYTCDGYRAPDGEIVLAIPAGADSAAYTPTPIPHRPIEELEVTNPKFWLVLLTYFWPLALVGVRLRWPARQRHWLMVAMEIALPPLSVWFILVVVVLGELAYGAVLSVVALTALWLLTLGEVWQRREERQPSR